MALLVSLDALLQERKVTGAAHRLGITQPAMSAQLAKLRILFGDPLLVSDGNRMVPTARAASLEAPLREHLAELHDLAFTETEFEPNTARRTFRIAATDYAHSVVVPPLISHLRTTAPGIRIAALPFPESDLRERLATDLDFAIASERMMSEDIPSRRLFEDGFLLAYRGDHPLLEGPVDLDLFCSLEHLLVSPSGGGFVGAVDEALASIGRSRNVVASLPAFLLAPPVLRRSDSVAVLPSRVMALDPSGLSTAAPPISLRPFPTILGWHRRLSGDPGHKWLRQTIAGLNRTTEERAAEPGHMI